MIKHLYPKMLMAAAALALAGSCAVATARTAHPAKAKVPEVVVPPVGAPAAYDALEHHVGDELVIETTLNTVRRGKLIKYTNPALVLQLGLEHGSIELTVPRETVRSIRVLPAAVANPDAAAHSKQGSDSAKKN